MNCNNEILNPTCGSDLPLLVTLVRFGQPFPVELSTNVVMNIVTERAERIAVDYVVGNNGKIAVTLKGKDYKPGYYGIEITGTINHSDWRAWFDSCILYTPETRRSKRSVEQTADPYDITMEVGLIGDVVPRNISELFDDVGLVSKEKLTEILKDYAPLDAPRFKGFPYSTDIRRVSNGGFANMGTMSPLATIVSAENIINSLKGRANGVASLGADGKVPIAQLLTEGNGGLVLRSLLGAINGVATLDGGRLVWDDQLRMGWRGYYTGDIDATNITPGIWGIDNRSLGAAILGDELAHGILVQFCDTQHRNYRTQLLLVGRNAQSPNGDALEIYARRYLPGKSGWGEWYSSAKTEYMIAKSDRAIQLLKNGKVVSEVPDANTTYSTMSQAEAEAGTATSGRTMSAKILKAAIEKHTENKATIDFVNSSTQTATAEFRGTHPSLEALQAVEADRNDYGYVEETDTDGNILVHRYKYVEGTGWQFEYDLNRTGFTAAEWQAIKSGITPEDVEKLRELPEKDTVMPLTRVVDKYTTEGLLNPDRCIESGIYENVGFPSLFLHNLNQQEIEQLCGKPCSLFVAEISSDENEENVQTFYGGIMHYGKVYYKTFIQVAFCGFNIAVRKFRHPVSWTEGVLATMEIFAWRLIPSFHDLDKYALKSDTLDRYKVGEEALIGEWEENGVAYDLYRKVVSFGELPNAGQKTVAHGIADKVKFTRVMAMASNGFPIPFVAQDPAKAIYLALGNNNITINTHATDRSALTADVTIEFTRAKAS